MSMKPEAEIVPRSVEVATSVKWPLRARWTVAPPTRTFGATGRARSCRRRGTGVAGGRRLRSRARCRRACPRRPCPRRPAADGVGDAVAHAQVVVAVAAADRVDAETGLDHVVARAAVDVVVAVAGVDLVAPAAVDDHVVTVVAGDGVGSAGGGELVGAGAAEHGRGGRAGRRGVLAVTEVDPQALRPRRAQRLDHPRVRVVGESPGGTDPRRARRRPSGRGSRRSPPGARPACSATTRRRRGTRPRRRRSHERVRDRGGRAQRSDARGRDQGRNIAPRGASVCRLEDRSVAEREEQRLRTDGAQLVGLAADAADGAATSCRRRGDLDRAVLVGAVERVGRGPREADALAGGQRPPGLAAVLGAEQLGRRSTRRCAPGPPGRPRSRSSARAA